jgi:dynein heavy chain
MGLVLLFRDWMEGPWGSLDPDVVDQETGNFWRGLYKLEKQFGEVPKAQSIAVNVSTNPSSCSHTKPLDSDCV